MVFLICWILAQEPSILKMTFDGRDRELAQGAIERHELEHREIERNVWLIRVESGTPDEWARRLTAAVSQGSFSGSNATAEEVERVRSGEIVLQK